MESTILFNFKMISKLLSLNQIGDRPVILCSCCVWSSRFDVRRQFFSGFSCIYIPIKFISYLHGMQYAVFALCQHWLAIKCIHMFWCTNNKQCYFKLNKVACVRANLIKTTKDPAVTLSIANSILSSFHQCSTKMYTLACCFFFNHCTIEWQHRIKFNEQMRLM